MIQQYDWIEDRLIKSLKNMNIQPKKVLDVGANLGQFYSKFKSVFPESDILSVEGNPSCEYELSMVNPNYKICFLSKEHSQKTFYINSQAPQCSGGSLYKEKTPFYETATGQIVDTITLDSLNLDFDYIKIDVQGSEMDVIKGGLKTILNCSILQLELSVLEYNLGSPFASQLISYLYNLDFYLYDVGGLYYWENRLAQTDFIFINQLKLPQLLNLEIFNI
jgi:FkbM family methyltransferase